MNLPLESRTKLGERASGLCTSHHQEGHSPVERPFLDVVIITWDEMLVSSVSEICLGNLGGASEADSKARVDVLTLLGSLPPNN